MRLIMCTRRSVQGEIEAEPVRVDVSQGSAELILDDGELLVFDAAQLAEALEVDAAANEAREAA
jgi:hypothetical protein